ncbi:MAG: hypothetical protein WCQ90_13160 [Deltaproteobacteria bacterium]
MTPKSALIIGAVLLLIYPGVLLAGIMSLAAKSYDSTPFFLVWAAKIFLFASIAYPAVYLPCLVAFWVTRHYKQESIAAKLAFIPLGYLGLLIVLLAIWAGASFLCRLKT